MNITYRHRATLSPSCLLLKDTCDSNFQPFLNSCYFYNSSNLNLCRWQEVALSHRLDRGCYPQRQLHTRRYPPLDLEPNQEPLLTTWVVCVLGYGNKIVLFLPLFYLYAVDMFANLKIIYIG